MHKLATSWLEATAGRNRGDDSTVYVTCSVLHLVTSSGRLKRLIQKGLEGNINIVLVREKFTCMGSAYVLKFGNKFGIFRVRRGKFYTQKPYDFPVPLF
jgi:hypothetical protein